MGKGRAPCCDKTKVKRGPWSPEEDMKLISFIQKFGHENWRSLPKQSGLLRCGKSCRLRWINYLRPDLKRGNFTPEEEQTIIKLHQDYGNKWSKIASQLPGRTDNEIKNVWHTHLKKRLLVQSSRTDLTTDVPGSPCSNNQELLRNELSTSLSYACSNHSDQKDDLMFEYIEEAYSEFKDIIQEVDKPELLEEIPFDSDPEIWSFLNSFEQSASNENSLAASRTEEEKSDEDDEVKKWFKHLETELGLEEDDNQPHKESSASSSSSSLLKTYELMIH